MTKFLRISVTFLDGRYYGRSEGGEPEWPPSPLRLLQAVVAANATALDRGEELRRALIWLECQPAPIIVAPCVKHGAPYVLAVPNNAMDLVAASWAKGGNANPAEHRAMKTVSPMTMHGGETVHFVWQLQPEAEDAAVEAILSAARNVFRLGWGLDTVVTDACRVDSDTLSSLSGERWSPVESAGYTGLRVPLSGTLGDLEQRHKAFLGRLGAEGFSPVPPLTAFRTVQYRRPTDPTPRLHVVFELRKGSGDFLAYAQKKLIHLAGMTRHLAGRAMSQSPPPDAPKDWVERYVMGHREAGDKNHRQLSYVPLPSIGHQHADQSLRRVLISAPPGDERWLEHLVRRITGTQLIPERGTEFDENEPPTLVRIRSDRVLAHYIRPSNRWTSVTPVILPGHDDRKRTKTQSLIKTALRQSGVEQPCRFEWSQLSKFRKSYSAHKYGRDRRPQGFLRPDHLLTQTAVHLTLEFEDEVRIPGPLVIGAGRHLGLGLMARYPGA